MDADLQNVELRGLRERLAALARTRGQAGLARKGKTTRRNVHRYLAGTRPPADFLINLVRSLGLNPGWLLLGTGRMYSGEAPAGEGNPQELLTAIEIADATAELRLHTLSQLPNLSSYREILQQLERAEGVRSSREKQMADALKKLFNRALENARFPNYDEALPILRAIERLLPLVNAPQLAVATYTFLGTVLNNTRRENEAAACWGKALLFSLLSGEKLSDQGFQSALGLAISAMGKGETGRALHFTTVLDVLDAQTNGAASPKVRALNRMTRAECLITVGRLSDGVAALQQAIADRESATPEDSSSFAAVAQLWSGLAPMDVVAAQKVRDVHFALGLASFALFTETEHDLEAARASLSLAAQSSYVVDERVVRHVSAVLAAIQGGKRSRNSARGGRKEVGEVPGSSAPDEFSRLVRRVQINRLRGDPSALQDALECHAFFLGHCQSEHRYTLSAIMAHIKNLLSLFVKRAPQGAAEAREWARVELIRRYMNGFSALAAIPGVRELISR